MPTDWADSSMHITAPGEDYQASLGQFLAMLGSMQESGQRGSDTTRVAQVLLKMVDEPNPPPRLLISSDAVQIVLAMDEAKLAETRKWQAVSEATTFTPYPISNTPYIPAHTTSPALDQAPPQPV
jgi:hypothetical protein